MNILVVDDEPLTHIPIEKLIQSGEKDVFVFHTCNGRGMLERLAEHHFSLAYVDIKMPGISGLEALKKAREISPFTSYYIMTGPDEFEYAKRATKLKVNDHPMRPLGLKTIQETIQSARLQRQKNLEHKKDLFRNWLESTLNRRESSFGEYTGIYCCLLLVTVDMEGIPKVDATLPLQSYEDNIVSVFTEEGLLLLCFSEEYEHIRQTLKDLSGCSCPPSVTCPVSSVTREQEEIRAVLPLLVKHVSLRVVLGLNRFYYMNPLQNCEASLLGLCQLVVQMQTAYGAKEYTKFSNTGGLLLNQYHLLDSIEKYRKYVTDYLSLILRCHMDAHADTGTLAGLFDRAGKELLNAPTMESKAQSIVRFIQEHYHENISAAELASHFDLSTNYISSLLKNTLGIRYNGYVTQLRLNHAKELLVSTHLSIKDVMAVCGYYSQSHLTRLFIDHVGCMPVECRKNSLL